MAPNELAIDFIEAFLMAFGVFEPKDEILGIDLELRLADLELCKLGVLGASEMDRQGNFGEPKRSQNWPCSEEVGGTISSLETSDLSNELPGDVDENR